MLLLGIESSCDETSAAIVEDGDKILSNVIVSQIKVHQEYGGVVPEIASRKHTENISVVLDQTFKKAGVNFSDINAVAVSNQPGLFGSLIIGVTAAKTFSMVNKVPLVGVNHIIGHIYANFIGEDKPQFPFICLVVSGGHTFIARIDEHLQFNIIGRTRDDAAGEAYDKVARFLGLGYPGGPVIDQLAVQGDVNNFRFPRAIVKDTYDFSFSGLKTAVINKVHTITDDPMSLSKEMVADIAAGFQDSVVDVLTSKTIQVAKETGIGTICVAGGVSANKGLRSRFDELCNREGIKLHIPAFEYCTDNAAMIAVAGFYRLRAGLIDDLSMPIYPNFSL